MPPHTAVPDAAAVTLGTGLFLIAIGAILRFAVTAELAGIDIQTVGTILMVIGVIGFLIGLWMYLNARRGVPPPP